MPSHGIALIMSSLGSAYVIIACFSFCNDGIFTALTTSSSCGELGHDGIGPEMGVEGAGSAE